MNPAAMQQTRPKARGATTADASDIVEIVRAAGLDQNSHYIYSLWCHDFSDYTAVAVDNGVVVGFIMCYPRPDAVDHLFIWQAGVLPAYRGFGLAGMLLHHVYTSSFSFVECSVTPSNSSSLKFLRKFADDVAAPFLVTDFLDESVLGSGHEREDLVSIGPIPSDRRGPFTQDDGKL